GAGRGTIIYVTEGSVFVDRGRNVVYNRNGEVVKEYNSANSESGTALGGGGDISTDHMVNFFETIRGKEKLTAPIDDANISMALVHYTNIAYRIGIAFHIDQNTGRFQDPAAMKLWGRTYEKGWEPTL